MPNPIGASGVKFSPELICITRGSLYVYICSQEIIQPFELATFHTHPEGIIPRDEPRSMVSNN